MALIETSALDSSNVNLAFECIIKEIYKVSLTASVAQEDQMMRGTLSKSTASASANQPQLPPQPAQRKKGIKLSDPSAAAEDKATKKKSCCSR